MSPNLQVGKQVYSPSCGLFIVFFYNALPIPWNCTSFDRPVFTCPPHPEACFDHSSASSPSSSHPTPSDHASCGPGSPCLPLMLLRGPALDG
jgi:hypothetical protein